MGLEDKILEYFLILKKKDILGHSYLFLGDSSSSLVKIIKLINCRESEKWCDACWDCRALDSLKHPDLFIIEPDPLFIRIEKIREAQHFLQLKSFRLKKKVVIMKEASTITEEAANAFLKYLEEPPKNSFLALCAQSCDKILPTIVSRCRKIFIGGQQPDWEVMPESLLNDALCGRIDKFGDRRKLKSFLLTFITVLHNYMLSKISRGRLPADCGLSSLELFQPYSVEKITEILDRAFMVYSAYETINEKLALNLIRAKL